jgi:hypothetical protein
VLLLPGNAEGHSSRLGQGQGHWVSWFSPGAESSSVMTVTREPTACPTSPAMWNNSPTLPATTGQELSNFIVNDQHYLFVRVWMRICVFVKHLDGFRTWQNIGEI